MRTLEVCEKADISYRQLDYWVRKGLVSLRSPGSGTGTSRDFTHKEAAIVIRAGALLKLGIKPEPAVEYARLMIEQNCDAVEVNGWIIGLAEEDQRAPELDELSSSIANVTDVSDMDPQLGRAPGPELPVQRSTE